jgi:nucleoside-diphosphate-sugar epimerase
MMRVAVIGATGVIGRQVVQRLREHGHRVRAVARSEADIEALRRVGIEAVPADILDHQDLRGAIEGCSVALHLATAAPCPGQAPNLALNDRIRREGTANLLEACRGAGVQRYVHQSLAFLVGGSSDIVDEATPLLPATKVTASAIDAERLVAASGLDWVILRGGALYGPGTGREEHWRALARSGELRFPGDGSDYISLIHVADLAACFTLAAKLGPSGSIVSVVDSEPTTYRELFTYVARLEGGAVPTGGGVSNFSSFRVANSKAQEILGWRPFYRSYRSGLI